MDSSPIRYVQSEGLSIAYRWFGSSGPDLLLMLPSLGTIEMLDEPPALQQVERIAGFGRLIGFDRRGSGLSDRTGSPATLEEQMTDIVAVLDACGSTRVSALAEAEGAMLATMFAATHPDRVSHLITTLGMARTTRAPGYVFAWTRGERRQMFPAAALARWGTGETGALIAPVLAARDPRFTKWWGRWERLSMTPGEMVRNTAVTNDMDVREILPQVQAPTLVLDRPDAKSISSEHARYLHERIPNSELRELPGSDGISFGDGSEAWLEAIEEFTLGKAASGRTRRALATVLFTDIVESTRQAAEVGDQRWRETLERHDSMTRTAVTGYGGRAIKSTGDGFLATFDGPAQAIRCASAISADVGALGIAVRAGLHAGEVEMIGSDVGGIAVHIGARIGALGGPGEVLVSSTVRDLVAGSGIGFESRGSHDLEGVPGEWALYQVTAVDR
jgi:class 3 adenylate cyclase